MAKRVLWLSKPPRSSGSGRTVTEWDCSACYRINCGKDLKRYESVIIRIDMPIINFVSVPFADTITVVPILVAGSINPRQIHSQASKTKTSHRIKFSVVVDANIPKWYVWRLRITLGNPNATWKICSAWEAPEQDQKRVQNKERAEYGCMVPEDGLSATIIGLSDTQQYPLGIDKMPRRENDNQ